MVAENIGLLINTEIKKCDCLQLNLKKKLLQGATKL